MKQTGAGLDTIAPAHHGAVWGDSSSRVLLGKSKGKGVAVEIGNPLRALPRRITGSTQDVQLEVRGGRIYLTPQVDSGKEFYAVVEY